MRRVLPLLLLAVLTACEPNRPPAPSPIPSRLIETEWGAAQALTWAPVFDPPALATDGPAALVGAFELINAQPTLVVYRDGRRLRSNITALRPFELTLFAAPNSGSVAFWLDDDGTGIQRLFVARMNDTGFSERGSIEVSSGAAVRYSAAALPDRSYWAVWSAPVTGESVLVGSRVDSDGRPRSAQSLRSAADYPALTVTNSGNVLLFWLSGRQLDLYRAELTDAGLTFIDALQTAAWSRQAADQLVRLDAGLDTTHAYVFWQVRTGLGLVESWYLSLPLTSMEGPAARRLAVSLTGTSAQTGFNHRQAVAARLDPGGMTLTWASPARGQNETLPVTAVFEGRIGIIYFRGGEVAAAQALALLPGALVAAPRTAADSERDLLLSWWQPDTLQEAVLYVIESGDRR